MSAADANPHATGRGRNPANHVNATTPIRFLSSGASVYPDRLAVGHRARRYSWRGPVEDLQARALGAVWARLREQLTPERDKIDGIVEKHSSGKAGTQRAKRIRSRRLQTVGRLFD